MTTANASMRIDTPVSPPVTPDISVVIVSWNTADLLDDCLRSVFESIQSIDVDVWVVDNASRDDSVERVRRKYPRVKLMAMDDNLGFARGNNVALRQAKGRYLLLLNSDTIVPPGALDGLAQALDARPDAAVASPLLLNGDGTPQICWARFPGAGSELKGELDRGQSPYPLTDFDDPIRRAAMEPFAVDWVGGACFCVRASAVPGVGLLDEAFFMYSEETEWCQRFKAAGHLVLLVPALTVTHLGGQSAQAVPFATRRRMWLSSLRFYRLAYGTVGSLPARLVATARYGLFHLKHRLRAGKGNR